MKNDDQFEMSTFYEAVRVSEIINDTANEFYLSVLRFNKFLDIFAYISEIVFRFITAGKLWQVFTNIKTDGILSYLIQL